MRYDVYPSSPGDKKKFRVKLPSGRVIGFGAKGMSDYTIHKDYGRMRRYLARHRAREVWSKDGIDTAGFWSRWLLWSKPDLKLAAKTIESKFNVKVVLKKSHKIN